MSGPEDYLQVPLPLAEMLHATLGPLSYVLNAEGHEWAPLVDRVLKAYTTGRDDQMVKRYGSHILPEVDMCTAEVVRAVMEVSDEMASEGADFEQWTQEFINEHPQQS